MSMVLNTNFREHPSPYCIQYAIPDVPVPGNSNSGSLALDFFQRRAKSHEGPCLSEAKSCVSLPSPSAATEHCLFRFQFAVMHTGCRFERRHIEIYTDPVRFMANPFSTMVAVYVRDNLRHFRHSRHHSRWLHSQRLHIVVKFLKLLRDNFIDVIFCSAARSIIFYRQYPSRS
jgi:hypothetical protein